MLKRIFLAVIASTIPLASAYALTGERILKSPEWFIMVLASKMEQHATCQLSDTETLDVIISTNARDLHDFVGVFRRGQSFEVRNRSNRSFNGLMVFTDISTGNTDTAALFSATKSGNNQYLILSSGNVSAESEWHDEMLVVDVATKTIGPHSSSDRLTLERDYACTFSPAEEVKITAQEPIRRAVTLVRDEWHAVTGNR